jgi:outer membrane protein TolC
MLSGRARTFGLSLCILTTLGGTGCLPVFWGGWLGMPEQRTIQVRSPSQLPKIRRPAGPPPPTVADPQPDLTERRISLDEAIRITLSNSTVVRVLAGTTAVSSGRTIYDPGIANTTIDQEQARFDPQFNLNNNFNRIETPTAVLDPLSPVGATITGFRNDDYSLSTGISKTNVAGGTLAFNINDNLDRFTPGIFPLDPQNRDSLTLSYTQPLLQGAGIAPNLAPVVIARINTEISYFQFKDSMDQSVRGVIEAYWALVFARTDAWARRQQVQQGTAALERAEARSRLGFGSSAEVAQARSALANFKATLIIADANVIQREAALRNIMGLPPSDSSRLVPITPPSASRLNINWDEIVNIAEDQRPDLIELKLIVEADRQMIIQARNNALPKLDTTLLYRWNGLEGRTPTRANLSTEGGEFTDWTLGLNFSVPLGLRQSRAGLRQKELILARDSANLDQGFHAALHDLATSTRNVAEFYEEYQALKEARVAARLNLDLQVAAFRAGRTIFLNVLQAITDWGNSVSAEAQALTQYNTDLADLERQTGTILNTHGIQFYEERFASIGPFGRLARPRWYAAGLPPGPNRDVYPTSREPAENFFDLQSPLKRDSDAAPIKGPPLRELPTRPPG